MRQREERVSSGKAAHARSAREPPDAAVQLRPQPYPYLVLTCDPIELIGDSCELFSA